MYVIDVEATPPRTLSVLSRSAARPTGQGFRLGPDRIGHRRDFRGGKVRENEKLRVNNCSIRAAMGGEEEEGGEGSELGGEEGQSEAAREWEREGGMPRERGQRLLDLSVRVFCAEWGSVACLRSWLTPRLFLFRLFASLGNAPHDPREPKCRRGRVRVFLVFPARRNCFRPKVFLRKMVLHMVDLVSSHDVFYEDCPQSGGSFTGLEDFNMNHCLNTTTMIPGKMVDRGAFSDPNFRFRKIAFFFFFFRGRAERRGEGGEGRACFHVENGQKPFRPHCFAGKKQTTR